VILLIGNNRRKHILTKDIAIPKEPPKELLNRPAGPRRFPGGGGDEEEEEQEEEEGEESGRERVERKVEEEVVEEKEEKGKRTESEFRGLRF